MEKTRTIFNVTLPRRAVSQPVPFFAKGGDCSYCCLAGVMQCSVEEAYARCDQKYEGASWCTFKTNLHTLERKGFIDRHISDVPFWPTDLYDGHMTWGAPSVQMTLSWFNYVLMAMDAGYYGFCTVSHSKRKYLSETDHKVLVCGARQLLTEKFKENGEYDHGAYSNEILVSCSSRATPDEEWVNVSTFLREWGGFNIQLARPSKFLRE